MKTINQEILINTLKAHTQFWYETDDLDCSSHNLDIFDQIILLQEKGIKQRNAERFGNLLQTVLTFLRNSE